MFGNNGSDASEAVWRWINGIEGEGKRLRVVIGGRLTRELYRNGQIRDWLIRGVRRANVIVYDNKAVDLMEKEVSSWNLKSDDPHVIALALVSGARLLYSNDLALQKDFRNAKLVSRPKGKIYTAVKFFEYDKVKKKLLEDCRCKS